MKTPALIQKAQAVLKRDQKRKTDPRYIRTIGLLSGKGMLLAPNVSLAPSAKVAVSDAYWVATHIEPRVWEILPAAVLHFPRSFIGAHAFPELMEVVSQLKREQVGNDFKGVPFNQIKRWADFKPADGRTKSLADLKIMRSFRLSKDCIAKIVALAQERGISQSQLIEKLLSGR